MEDHPPVKKARKCKYCGEPATEYDLMISSDVCEEHARFSRELLVLARKDVGITTFSKEDWKNKN
jgi:hypothetical protein